MTKLLLPPVSGLLTQPMDEDESQHWISPGLFALYILYIFFLAVHIYIYSCMYIYIYMHVNFMSCISKL